MMSDVIMIDWSLWEEANEERIVKDTKDVYESVSPIIFKAGWECGASHNQEDCTTKRTTHSPEWLDLHRVMRAQQLPLRCLDESIANTASKCRQEVENNDQKADVVRALMLSTGDAFTESDLVYDALRVALRLKHDRHSAISLCGSQYVLSCFSIALYIRATS